MAQFPMGSWNYMPPEKLTVLDVKRWADCGMTLTMSPTYTDGVSSKKKMLEIMDECVKYGIKLIICDKRALWNGAATKPQEYRKRFRAAYADFGNHPATWGFHIGDEPMKVNMPDVIAAHKIQLEEAPKLNPFVNFFPIWVQSQYMGYGSLENYFKELRENVPARLICYDKYTQMCAGESGTKQYFHDMKRYFELAESKDVPLWTTLLCVAHYDYLLPSEDGFRWQLNTALACGCRGLLWFMFYLSNPIGNYRDAPINMFGETTRTYENLSFVLREFKATLGEIFTHLRLKKSYHYLHSWGEYPLYEDGISDFLIKVTTRSCVDAIFSFYHDENGREYMAVVNNSKTECDLMSLTFAKAAGRVYKVESIDKEILLNVEQCSDPVKNGDDTYTCAAWFAPGQLKLFRFE